MADRARARRDRSIGLRKRRKPAETIPLVVADVYELAGAFQRFGDRLAARYRQSGARWKVLSAASVDPPRTVAQLARRLGLARQSVQRIVDRIVEDSLATYEDNPDHRRSPLVRLTGAGREALDGLTRNAAEWHERLAERLRGVDLESILEGLRALSAAMHELEDRSKNRSPIAAREKR